MPDEVSGKSGEPKELEVCFGVPAPLAVQVPHIKPWALPDPGPGSSRVPWPRSQFLLALIVLT